ncbi:MAG: hypothetical protein R3F61_25530 [Myxococcota bacterium]
MLPTFALLAACGASEPREAIDVFFLGNSYTEAYALPGMVAALSEGLDGPVIRAEAHVHGGFSLRDHLEDGHLPDVLHATVAGEPLELVVLQEQSTLGVKMGPDGTIGDPVRFHDAVRELVPLIRERGAEPVLYATWAKQAFPKQTPALTEAFRTVGEETKARVSPVGRAWAEVGVSHPEIGLYAKDGSHPSPAGAYLSACVLYATLTGRSPVGASRSLSAQHPVRGRVSVSVTAAEAAVLQEVAARVAL